MVMNFIQDDHGMIERAVKRVIKDHKEFNILGCLRFLYTYKLNDPQYDKDGLPIEGLAKKLSNRERDVYERDVEICVHYDSWTDKPKEQKYRLIYRILLSIHVDIEGKEELEIVTDDDGRVVLRIVPPDIVLRLYSKELEEFGLPSQYKRTVKTLSISEKHGEDDE
jgi:hypothetical protein